MILDNSTRLRRENQRKEVIIKPQTLPTHPHPPNPLLLSTQLFIALTPYSSNHFQAPTRHYTIYHYIIHVFHDVRQWITDKNGTGPISLYILHPCIEIHLMNELHRAFTDFNVNDVNFGIWRVSVRIAYTILRRYWWVYVYQWTHCRGMYYLMGMIIWPGTDPSIDLSLIKDSKTMVADHWLSINIVCANANTETTDHITSDARRQIC